MTSAQQATLDAARKAGTEQGRADADADKAEGAMPADRRLRLAALLRPDATQVAS